MYIEFNGYRKVEDEEAFMFACGMLEDGTESEKETFMDIVKDSETFEEARKGIIDYVFSENWVYRKSERSQGFVNKFRRTNEHIHSHR